MRIIAKVGGDIGALSTCLHTACVSVSKVGRVNTRTSRFRVLEDLMRVVS